MKEKEAGNDERAEKCVERFLQIQKMIKQIIENIMKNTEVGLTINTANDTHFQTQALNDTVQRKSRVKSTQKAAKNIHHLLAVIPLTMNESTSESTKGASIIERDLKILLFLFVTFKFLP